MSDIKELNSEELGKIAGGEKLDDVRFAAGDWIKDDHSAFANPETVYYIKEAMNDTYNLIQYEHFVNNNPAKRNVQSRCLKTELYNQSYKFYRYPMYHKIDKPTWIED